jgi:hypothetical protein
MIAKQSPTRFQLTCFAPLLAIGHFPVRHRRTLGR